MAEELEVSLRTLYRDIADLVTDGVPIHGEAGVGYVLGEGYDLPPLMFNADELEAVMLGLRWVRRRGDEALLRAAEDAVAKVGTILPKDLKSVLYEAALLVPPGYQVFKDRVDLALMRRAMREQRKVSIVCADEQGRETTRVIWPIAISYFDAQRLVVGWCEMRNDFRHFRSDRISAAQVQDERYRERRQVLLKRWTQQEGVSPHNAQIDVFM